MSIPDYQSIMLPLLRFAGDSAEHSLREAIDTLADQFKLSADERQTLLPSGQQTFFDNRVGWARTYLKKAGLLESTRRGYFRISPRGKDVLSKNPASINIAYLKQFAEFVEFQTTHKPRFAGDDSSEPDDSQTPAEDIESAYQRVKQGLAEELLQAVAKASPSFFERLVIDLLLKMGYGGTRLDAGERLGRSGDGGVDGIIKEDRLGLDAIYVQAKRWDGAVGRPEIQKFAGALQGQRARKGIFITTSSFTSEAHEYIERIDSKIVLIDGETLSRLMIDYNVGVAPLAVYELKKVDLDYFTEE